MSKKLKKLYLSKTIKLLLSIPYNQMYYTSLAYRDDKKRRGLGELKQHGYFEQLSRFVYKRTNKQYNG